MRHFKIALYLTQRIDLEGIGLDRDLVRSIQKHLYML